MYLRFFNPSKVYSRKQLETMKDDVKKALASLQEAQSELSSDEVLASAAAEYKQLAVNTQIAIDKILETNWS